jgi:flagellin
MVACINHRRRITVATQPNSSGQMLSLHTSSATLAAQSAVGRSGNRQSTAQTRLSTGYRINSAMDDAAGLQIATRLNAQSHGMSVAMRNTEYSISMLQTADGVLDDVSQLLVRIGALATQAADASSSQADRDALNSEYVTLSEQVLKTLHETPYNGTPLIRYKVGSPGTLSQGPITFQTGAAAADTVTVDFRNGLGWLNSTLYYAIDQGRLENMPVDGPGTELTTAEFANALLDKITAAIDATSTVRSAMGATSNRLQSSYNNLSNMLINTTAAEGRIMDTDFASESAEMTRSQMLTQAGMGMLKQSSSISQLVMSLIQ